jgi:alanine racemase
LKLAFHSSDVVQWIQPLRIIGELDLPIQFISTDSRNLLGGKNGCFVALKGHFRSGEQFIESAYQKNVRVFISSQIPALIHPDAVYLIVEQPLKALQLIASMHRKTITCPVVAIAGKNGKTTVKEWVYELIKSKFHVVRSPKSYNSQLGVPLSLLELTSDATMGLIEVGISMPGELQALEALIEPTHAIVTSFFPNESALNEELLEFLASTPNAYSGEHHAKLPTHVMRLDQQTANPELKNVVFTDQVSIKSATIAIGFSKQLVHDNGFINEQVSTLRRLALRLETFNGKNNTIVVNDTYNLDLDALKYSLDYLSSFDRTRPHCIYVGLDANSLWMKPQLEAIIQPYNPTHVFIDLPEALPLSIPEGAVVLIKGTRKASMERFAARLRQKQHQTKLEINFSALRNNLVQFKNLLGSEVKLLAMVKAQSYGSGLEHLAGFLEAQGVDYLGVAYTSEGVALRKHGIQLPILVLNPDPESYLDCIEFALEPTIFTFNQLDLFIRTLIESDMERYPIHVEVDTGMRRLGFEPSEIKSLLEVCQAQPEVFVKGVFTHFVEAEETSTRLFSLTQIHRFEEVISLVKKQTNHEILCHMANSEGIVNFPEAHFNMVRLGLGMFGLTNSRLRSALEPVLSWKSVVSQVKGVPKGESVSYSRSFIASEDMKIAIIPLGYADGFSRSLSNGVGGVWIHNRWCATVGRVCMDMLMVDVSQIDEVCEGDEVVIFDSLTRLEQFASQQQTISYEVMTSISDRVHRVYIHE